MRSLVALLAISAISLAALPLVGCGSSKPDPREREGFIDTSDPGETSLYKPEDFERGKPRRGP